jgi:hypothetical protein
VMNERAVFCQSSATNAINDDRQAATTETELLITVCCRQVLNENRLKEEGRSWGLEER